MASSNGIAGLLVRFAGGVALIGLGLTRWRGRTAGSLALLAGLALVSTGARQVAQEDEPPEEQRRERRRRRTGW